MYCNGKDVFDSMNAMAEAREYAIANQKPVLMHANCVRIGSHSNSDKHTLYRDENELKYVKEADPLHKFRRMLLRYKRFTEEELQAIEAEVKKEVSAANKKALAAPDPDPKSIFDFVIPEPYKPEKYVDGTHNEEGEKKKEETAKRENILILKSVNVIGKLTMANAIAIRDGRTNGELHAALEDYDKVNRELYDYLLEQNANK